MGGENHTPIKLDLNPFLVLKSKLNTDAPWFESYWSEHVKGHELHSDLWGTQCIQDPSILLSQGPCGRLCSHVWVAAALSHTPPAHDVICRAWLEGALGHVTYFGQWNVSGSESGPIQVKVLRGMMAFSQHPWSAFLQHREQYVPERGYLFSLNSRIK